MALRKIHAEGSHPSARESVLFFSSRPFDVVGWLSLLIAIGGGRGCNARFGEFQEVGA